MVGNGMCFFYLWFTVNRRKGLFFDIEEENTSGPSFELPESEQHKHEKMKIENMASVEKKTPDISKDKVDQSQPEQKTESKQAVTEEEQKNEAQKKEEKVEADNKQETSKAQKKKKTKKRPREDKELDMDTIWAQMCAGTYDVKPKKKKKKKKKTITNEEPKKQTTTSIDKTIDDFYNEMQKETLEKSKIEIKPTEEKQETKAKPEKKSGLDKLLEKLQKKQESTIKKSKKDWEEFKEMTGIKEEVERAAKDGYLGKKEFLERTELREFERDRELRLREQEARRFAEQQKKK